MKIAIIGSRTIPAYAFNYLADLAEYLAQDGHHLVSGGCLQGADQACATGAHRVNSGEHLTLWLSPRFHGRDLRAKKYPLFATCHMVYPTYDPIPVEQALAQSCAYPEQWNSQYRELFNRNGYVASYADVIIEWRVNDSRGTAHTLRCARTLSKPILNCALAYQQAPWANSQEFCERIGNALARIKQKHSI